MEMQTQSYKNIACVLPRRVLTWTTYDFCCGAVIFHSPRHLLATAVLFRCAFLFCFFQQERVFFVGIFCPVVIFD